MEPQHKIALLQSSSLTTVVQQEIERAILSGEMAPGAKLIEAGIAERLGVSRGPVREAFRMLEEAGLVRQEKNRGVFVRHIPLDEAMEIFEMRAMMEEAVGRKLAQVATPEQIKSIKAMVDEMERAVKAGDIDAYHLLNLSFHDRLVEYSGNRKLIALYRKMINELSLFRRLNLSDGKQLPQSAQEHRSIVKAIASRDPELAGRAMRAHIEGSQQRTLRKYLEPAVAAAPAPVPRAKSAAKTPPSPAAVPAASAPSNPARRSTSRAAAKKART